jgi:hypothetical protein
LTNLAFEPMSHHLEKNRKEKREKEKKKRKRQKRGKIEEEL